MRAMTPFRYTLVPYGENNQHVRGIIANCGKCDAAVPLPVNTISSHSPNNEIEFQFIQKKLAAVGWYIGRNRGEHRCPKCFHRGHHGHKRKPVGLDTGNVSHTHVSTALSTHTIGHLSEGVMAGKLAREMPVMKVVENVRVMTREDRRIIFEKLQEVYVSDKVGYSDGWGDERVSVDLGVPRNWVRVIRDENFGDEMSSETIRAQLVEARKTLGQVRELEPEIRRLLGLTDKIERTLADIAKVLK